MLSVGTLLNLGVRFGIPIITLRSFFARVSKAVGAALPIESILSRGPHDDFIYHNLLAVQPCEVRWHEEVYVVLDQLFYQTGLHPSLLQSCTCFLFLYWKAGAGFQAIMPSANSHNPKKAKFIAIVGIAEHEPALFQSEFCKPGYQCRERFRLALPHIQDYPFSPPLSCSTYRMAPR